MPAQQEESCQRNAEEKESAELEAKKRSLIYEHLLSFYIDILNEKGMEVSMDNLLLALERDQVKEQTEKERLMMLLLASQH